MPLNPLNQQHHSHHRECMTLTCWCNKLKSQSNDILTYGLWLEIFKRTLKPWIDFGVGEIGSKANTKIMQRLQSWYETNHSSSSSIDKLPFSSINQLDIPQFNQTQFRARNLLTPDRIFILDSAKRVGIHPSYPNQIPSISPYSQFLVSRSSANQQLATPTHSWS